MAKGDIVNSEPIDDVSLLTDANIAADTSGTLARQAIVLAALFKQQAEKPKPGRLRRFWHWLAGHDFNTTVFHAKRDYPISLPVEVQTMKDSSDAAVQLKQTIIFRLANDGSPCYSVLNDSDDPANPAGTSKRGGFGKVSKIQGTLKHTPNGMRYGDKKRRVDKNIAADKTALKDMQREARILKQLNHHTKALILEMKDGRLVAGHLVQEEISGTRLDVYMEKLRNPTNGIRLSPEQYIRVARNFLFALNVIHLYGVAHFDLKPSNILIDEETGQIKIIDLGFAQNIKIDNFTEVGGSIAMVAPETLLYMNDASPKPDTRADIYSAALCLAVWLGAIGRPSVTDVDAAISDLLARFISKQQTGSKETANFDSLGEKTGLNTVEIQSIKDFLRDRMMCFNPKDRGTLDEAIDFFDQLELAYKPSDLHKAYQVAREVEWHFARIQHEKIKNPLSYMREVMRDAVNSLDSSAESLAEFVNTLGMKVFVPARNKEDLLAITDSIHSNFVGHVDELLSIHGELERYTAFAPALTRETHQAVFAELKTVDRFLTKALNRPVTLDDMAELNGRFVGVINTAVTNIQTLQKDNTLSTHADLLNRCKPMNGTDEVTTLKNRVRAAVQAYLDETLLTSNVKKQDRAASRHRVVDMGRILDAVDHCTDNEAMEKGVRQVLGHMKVGFFYRSKLRSKVHEALSQPLPRRTV